MKDHGIMDYSLLLSAEKYSGGAIKNDRGESIDQPSPAGGLPFETSLNGPVRGLERAKSFFTRNSIKKKFTSKESLN